VRPGSGVSGLGMVLFASEKNPRPEPGRSDLCGHRLGGAGRAVVLVRVVRGLLGGGAGLGDAGNEALGQFEGTLQGAAGIGADVLEGGEGDHEEEDAPARVAGSNGDGGSCDVVILSVHVFLFVAGFFALSRKSAAAAGGQWEWSSEGTTCPGPRTKPRQ